MTNISANPAAQKAAQPTTTGRLLGQSYKNSQNSWETRNRGGTAAAPKKVKPIKKSIDPVDAMIAGYNVQAAKAAASMSAPTMQDIPVPTMNPNLMPATNPTVMGGTTPTFTGTVEGDAIRKKMAQGILAGIGAQATPSNMSFMLAWMQAEGVNPSYWNPMGTTLPMAGSSPVNDDNVQRYPSMAIGINALVKTLENGRYNDLIRGLKHSINPLQLASSNALTTWGTGGLVKQVLLSSMGGKNGR